MPALLLPLSLLALTSAAHAADDTPPPPPAVTGIGSSPTAPAKATAGVIPVATVTQIPPWLRGDVSLGYSFDRLGGHLTEVELEEPDATESADVEVGERTLSSHVLSLDAIFSAGPGVAITLGFPIHISDSINFGTSQTMVYDPTTGSGTMNGTEPVDLGVVAQGGGLEGVWIGVTGTPFSEAFTKRKNRVTWRIGGALRTPNKDNFYVESDGKRGAGNGGLGFRLENAFSTTIGGTQPYVSGHYQGNGKTSIDATDADGNAVVTELRGARSGSIRFGAEFLAAHNAQQDTDVRVDLHGVFDYSSWSTVPSGLYLPGVLDGTAGGAVQTSESADIGGGLGFSFQPVQYVRIGFFGQVEYHLSQRIESPYPIYTSGDTIRSLVGGNLTIRIR